MDGAECCVPIHQAHPGQDLQREHLGDRLGALQCVVDRLSHLPGPIPSHLGMYRNDAPGHQGIVGPPVLEIRVLHLQQALPPLDLA